MSCLSPLDTTCLQRVNKASSHEEGSMVRTHVGIIDHHQARFLVPRGLQTLCTQDGWDGTRGLLTHRRTSAWATGSISLEQELPYTGPSLVFRLRCPVKERHFIECVLGILLLHHLVLSSAGGDLIPWVIWENRSSLICAPLQYPRCVGGGNPISPPSHFPLSFSTYSKEQLAFPCFLRCSVASCCCGKHQDQGQLWEERVCFTFYF